MQEQEDAVSRKYMQPIQRLHCSKRTCVTQGKAHIADNLKKSPIRQLHVCFTGMIYSTGADLQGLLKVFPLLQQGGPNPVGGLTVCVINLPGRAEVMQGFAPVAAPPLQNAAVQAHLGTAQANLHVVLLSYWSHHRFPLALLSRGRMA